MDKCATPAKTHFRDAIQGSIYADIATDCQAGQAVTGPGRNIVNGPGVAAYEGKHVVIQADASAAGTLAVEDSPDGLTWTEAAAFPLDADVPQGLRFAPCEDHYRVKFTANADEAASRVTVYTQGRY